MARINTFLKVVALLTIMFGVSYNADAQLLGGLAKAVKNKANEAKQGKACEVPKADAKAKPATFSLGKNGEVPVCTWNPATLEITMLDEMAGNKKGDVIKLDPSTGKFTNNRGEDKGSISEDGTIISPHIGTLNFVTKDEGAFGTAHYVMQKFSDGRSLKVVNLSEPGSIKFFDTSVKVLGSNNQSNADGKYTGNPSLLLVGYVYGVLLLDRRTYTIRHDHYDPELKYTVAMLEDKIMLKNAGAESEIMEYESSRPYAGYDREKHPELKNCKVAAVGLTSEWKETKHEHTSGTRYEGTTWKKRISYWVLYELADGRNMVAFSTYIKNSGYESGVERTNSEWHEVTDWVRK